MKRMKPTNARSFLTVHAHSGTCPLISVTILPCIACLIMTLLLLSAPVLAETFVSGGVSGVWDVEGSPYLVTDTLIVPEGDTLLIEPGVVVEFQDQDSTHQTPFNVFGTLLALGTEEDSICFVTDSEYPFHGFASTQAYTNSIFVFEYCVINAAVEVVDALYSDRVTLRHCRIHYQEDVIYNVETPDTVEYCHFIRTMPSSGNVQTTSSPSCLFQNNNGYVFLIHTNGPIAPVFGNEVTGVSIHANSIELYDNWFRGSIALWSGDVNAHDNTIGITASLDECSGDFYRNRSQALTTNDCMGLTLSENTVVATENTRAVELNGSTVTLEHNLIIGNQIAIDISNCTNLSIVNNTLSFTTTGMYLSSTTGGVVVNNILLGDGYNCTGIHLAPSAEAPASTRYNSFYGVSQVTNGYELDEGNLFENPFLAGGDPFDYTLQANSPCIDAGDPDSPEDPDGTRADIGCFYYDQSIDNPPVQTIPENVFARTGHALRIEITATDDNGPFDFTFPDLPEWLIEEDELDWVGDTTAVSGTVPEDAEDFSFMVIVEDGEGQTDSSIVTVTVDARTILQGEISGTLHVEDSPFYVVEDIIVSEGDSLIIEPGCELQFRYVEDEEQRIGLDVCGCLISEGNATDSIRFITASGEEIQSSMWVGIKFQHCSDSSRISFSRIENTYRAVHVVDTSLISINNCFFYNNHTGVFMQNYSTIYINSTDFIFIGNNTYDGITSQSSTVYIDNSQFVCEDVDSHIYNLYCFNTHIYISNTLFYNGWADALSHCYVEIDNCVFKYIVGSLGMSSEAWGFVRNCLFYNQQEEYSYGLYVSHNSIIIENNVFHGFEQGIKLRYYSEHDSLPVIQNNLFMKNIYGIYWDEEPNPEVIIDQAQYNCFFQNDTLITNGELDSTNLIADPLLADTIDYFLYDISPLIDSGNPDSLYNNVDGTRNDIGRWGGPYGTSYVYPVWVQETPDDLPMKFELFAPFPNPFNNHLTIHFSLPQVTDVQLCLCNILGQRVREERWSSQKAGYHQRVVDASGLASGVYFIELKAGDQVRRVKTVLIK